MLSQTTQQPETAKPNLSSVKANYLCLKALLASQAVIRRLTCWLDQTGSSYLSKRTKFESNCNWSGNINFFDVDQQLIELKWFAAINLRVVIISPDQLLYANKPSHQLILCVDWVLHGKNLDQLIEIVCIKRINTRNLHSNYVLKAQCRHRSKYLTPIKHGNGKGTSSLRGKDDLPSQQWTNSRRQTRLNP